MQEIYFDNSSTTRVCDQALAEAVKEMQQEYGNPGSVHHLGAQAFHALQAAHTSLASALHALPEEIYFTGSGTEANNMLIFGVAEACARAGRRILVSAVEHPSVSEPAKYLLSRGFDVHFIPVDPQGRIRLDALAELLNEETILVSIMHVNNETGTIQPLTEAGSLIRRLAPQAIFHVDGVQSFGRVAVDLAAWQADAFVASGHKIHAPKGIALLWLKKERRIPPLLRGGGQERGMRSGTENMPGICAFAKASEIACAGMQEYARQMHHVKQVLLDAVSASLPDVYVNGPPLAEAAPHILNLSFPGARSEVLLHYLEEKGVYVSAGSACNSRSSKGSPVIEALGISPERVDSALRFSFSRENTPEEALAAAEVLQAAVTEIRLWMGRNRKRR